MVSGQRLLLYDARPRSAGRAFRPVTADPGVARWEFPPAAPRAFTANIGEGEADVARYGCWRGIEFRSSTSGGVKTGHIHKTFFGRSQGTCANQPQLPLRRR